METKIQVKKISDFIKLDLRCRQCDKKVVLEVSSSGLQEYKSGTKLIQSCFPYLTPSQREMLIRGYCEGCFDKLMKDVD